LSACSLIPFIPTEIPAIKAIKPENRWNIDKAGIIKGQGLNSLAVKSAQKRFIQKKQPGSWA
jgi:4-hydroxybenzoate polyprenyltransferase